MRVLFANPPTCEDGCKFNRPVRFPAYQFATSVLHPPLFLAYAAAYVRSRGHEVFFVDAQADSLGIEAFLEKVKTLNIDCAVYETSMPSFEGDAQIAGQVKQATGAKIVFVGPHASALPEECLKRSNIDAVVMGEYEISLAEYLEKGGAGVAGIGYRNGSGEPVINPRRPYVQDLDKLPVPARDLMPNNKYFDPNMKHPFTFVLAGRGCPYRCTFCNWPQILTGRGYRVRSANSIVDEIEGVIKNLGVKSVLFNDDTFTANKGLAIGVCHEMARRGIKLPWVCYSRADNTDVELLTEIRKAGCYLLKVGVESGNQGILDDCHKGYKLARIQEGVSTMKRLGFQVHCTFVFGLPGETPETMKRTVDFAIKLKPTTVQFSSAVPYPGTEFYNYLKERNMLKTFDWNEYMPLHQIFEYPDLPSQELVKMVPRAYRRFFFRPSYIFGPGLHKFLADPVVVASNALRLLKA